MPPRIALLHRTIYHYERPVLLGPQWIRLRPLPDPRWATPSSRLMIEPQPASLHWIADALGNPVARVMLAGPVGGLTIENRIELDLVPRNPFDFVLDAGCEQWPFTYASNEAAVLQPFTVPDATGPLLDGLRKETAGVEDTVGLVLALGARVRQRVAYVVRPEAGVWAPERTLDEGRGSCRDSAWLLVQLLRLHGLAARFVSGYLVQLATAERPDNAELHAWAEVFLPGAGWIGIDATSGLLTAEGHVALAAAPGPDGAAPLRGTMEPGAARLETTMTVERLAA